MILTSDQILEIRTEYISDQFIAANGVTAATALSSYNKATKSQFMTDAGLQSACDRVCRAYREELSGVYTDEYAKEIRAGLSTSAADVAATAMQNEAIYRLIRAEVFERMMLDSGFVGSVADSELRPKLFGMWVKQIATDRMFTRTRTSAPFRAIPIERY